MKSVIIHILQIKKPRSRIERSFILSHTAKLNLVFVCRSVWLGILGLFAIGRAGDTSYGAGEQRLLVWVGADWSVHGEPMPFLCSLIQWHQCFSRPWILFILAWHLVSHLQILSPLWWCIPPKKVESPLQILGQSEGHPAEHTLGHNLRPQSSGTEMSVTTRVNNFKGFKLWTDCTPPDPHWPYIIKIKTILTHKVRVRKSNKFWFFPRYYFDAWKNI